MGNIKIGIDRSDVFIIRDKDSSAEIYNFRKYLGIRVNDFDNVHSKVDVVNSLIARSKLNSMEKEIKKYTNIKYLVKGGYMQNSNYGDSLIPHYNWSFITIGPDNIVIRPQFRNNVESWKTQADLDQYSLGFYGGMVYTQAGIPNDKSAGYYTNPSFITLNMMSITYRTPSFIPRDYKYLVLEFMKGDIERVLNYNRYSNHIGPIIPLDVFIKPKASLGQSSMLSNSIPNLAPNKRVSVEIVPEDRIPYKMYVELKSDSSEEAIFELAYGYRMTERYPIGGFICHHHIKDIYLLK